MKDDDGGVADDEPVDTTLEDDDGKDPVPVLLLPCVPLALGADVPAEVAPLELVPADTVPVLVVLPLCVEVPEVGSPVRLLDPLLLLDDDDVWTPDDAGTPPSAVAWSCGALVPGQPVNSGKQHIRWRRTGGSLAVGGWRRPLSCMRCGSQDVWSRIHVRLSKCVTCGALGAANAWCFPGTCFLPA